MGVPGRRRVGGGRGEGSHKMTQQGLEAHVSHTRDRRLCLQTIAVVLVVMKCFWVIDCDAEVHKSEDETFLSLEFELEGNRWQVSVSKM